MVSLDGDESHGTIHKKIINKNKSQVYSVGIFDSNSQLDEGYIFEKSLKNLKWEFLGSEGLLLLMEEIRLNHPTCMKSGK